MCKFSIIVPIYNVSKYLEYCLNSIKEQTYNDYEVIMVDDGSKDDSSDIAKKYINDKFKYFHKKNGGLSSARNYGVKKSTGEYIMFVDSDDYIDKKTLENINKELIKHNNLDLLRYELRIVNENHKTIEEFPILSFSNKIVDEAFPILLKNRFVEPAPLYIINRKFYINNNFSFPENRLHEDFGLIPLVLINAKRISSIDYCGYNYVQRDGSIMTTTKYENTIKKVYDTLHHFDSLYSKAKNVTNISDETLKLFNSYITIAIISKIKYLKKDDKKHLILELKKRKVVNLLLDNTLKRKIRKVLYSINLNFSKYI